MDNDPSSNIMALIEMIKNQSLGGKTKYSANMALEDAIKDANSRLLKKPFIVKIENIVYPESKTGSGASELKKPEVTIRTMEPFTSSPDEIMQHVPSHHEEKAVTDTVPEHPQGFKRKFHPLGDEERSSFVLMNKEVNSEDKPSSQGHDIKMAAYRAIGVLSELPIEMVIGRLANVGSDRSHLWRCIITCRGIRGIADSARKIVAREMASSQFLCQLGEQRKDIKISEYEMQPEILIDPKILHNLEKAASDRFVDIGHDIRVKSVRPDSVGTNGNIFNTYVCTYYVRDKEFKGESLVVEYAQIVAARDAYIYLTGRVPQPTSYFTGGDCEKAFPRSAYDFTENELFQTVASIEKDGRELADNLGEAKIETEREERSDNFKKSKMDGEEGGRSTPVDLQPVPGFTSESLWRKTAQEQADMEVDVDWDD